MLIGDFFFGWRQQFKPNISKTSIFLLLLWIIRILRVIKENSYLEKYSTLQQGTHKIGFKCYSNVSMHFCIVLWKF